MAAIPAVMTLPGIAGLILSIGMALDANVLFFERMRVELKAGGPPRRATCEGFAHALSASIVWHATTLLTALVLYQFGTGPVRGFGVTLAIGLVASVFTAVFVTRTFFMIYLDRRPAAETISI
jgi:preprotein translocase subunit SecD